MTDARDTVRHRTVWGMLWTYGSYVAGRVLILVATAILAHLLAPNTFGLVAAALILVEIFEIVADLGMAQALVVTQNRADSGERETVLVASALAGLATSGVVAAISPLASRFFKQPELHVLVPVVASTIFIRTLGATHYALAQRELNFRKRAAIEMSDLSVRSVVGVALAASGFGAWSIALGAVGGALAFTASSWLLVHWRPIKRPRRAFVKPIASFGGALTVVSLIATLIANADSFVIGHVLGAGELGLYTLAFALPELLILNFSVVSSTVLFPAFALSRDAMPAALVRSVQYTVMLCTPLAVMLEVSAAPFIRVVFGTRWLSAASVTEVLVPYAFTIALAVPAGTLLKALGRARVLVWLAIPRLVIAVFLMIWGTRFGIIGVAGAQAVVALAFSAMSVVVARRHVGFSFCDIWKRVRAPVVAGLAMAASSLLAIHLIRGTLGALIVAGVVGTCTYGGVLVGLDRDAIRYIWAALSDPRVRVGPPRPPCIEATD